MEKKIVTRMGEYPTAHWTPRLQKAGITVENQPALIVDKNTDYDTELPQIDGVVYMLPRFVINDMKLKWVVRDDVCCLTVEANANQDVESLGWEGLEFVYPVKK